MTKIEAEYRQKLVIEWLEEKLKLLEQIVIDEEKDLADIRLTIEHAKSVQSYMENYL